MLLHLCDKQLVHEVRHAVLRHKGLHNVLVCTALSALMRLHVEPLQSIMLAQPCCAAHLHAAMHSPVWAVLYALCDCADHMTAGTPYLQDGEFLGSPLGSNSTLCFPLASQPRRRPQTPAWCTAL